MLKVITYQRRLQVHTKIPLSSGMEFLLKVFVFWIIRRPVRYDENRLEEAQRRKC